MVSQLINQARPVGNSPVESEIVDNLPVEQATVLPRRTMGAMPNSYAVEAYCDEVMLTADDLMYGEHVYPLQNIISMQIIKLHKKQRRLKTKDRNFVGLAAIAAGIVLALSPLVLILRAFGLTLAVASVVYLLIFYLIIGEQQTGEYGLLVEMKRGIKRVLTSHSLRAIQKLYHLLFHRLQKYNPANETLIVNMYTGEVSRESDLLT
ncbi:MAG: DUF6232 family protein [Cyanobacteria bacterium J06635_15]